MVTMTEQEEINAIAEMELAEAKAAAEAEAAELNGEIDGEEESDNSEDSEKSAVRTVFDDLDDEEAAAKRKLEEIAARRKEHSISLMVAKILNDYLAANNENNIFYLTVGEEANALMEALGNLTEDTDIALKATSEGFSVSNVAKAKTSSPATSSGTIAVKKYFTRVKKSGESKWFDVPMKSEFFNNIIELEKYLGFKLHDNSGRSTSHATKRKLLENNKVKWISSDGSSG